MLDTLSGVLLGQLTASVHQNNTTWKLPFAGKLILVLTKKILTAAHPGRLAARGYLAAIDRHQSRSGKREMGKALS